jgi:hypothetical protein
MKVFSAGDPLMKNISANATDKGFPAPFAEKGL